MAIIGLVSFSLYFQWCLPGDEAVKMHVYASLIFQILNNWGICFGSLLQALQFIKQLGNALHSELESRRSKQPLQLVYVIGPPHSENLENHDFGPEDMQSLNGAVDGFSLMTYDYSSPHSPGPNAPLNWIRSALRLVLGTKDNNLVRHEAAKIFLGINFYGYDFSLSGGRNHSIFYIPFIGYNWGFIWDTLHL